MTVTASQAMSNSLSGTAQRFGLASLSGSCLGAASLYPELYPLTWIAFVPLLFAIRHASLRETYAAGLVAGLCLQLSAAYWLADFIANLKDYGTVRSTVFAAAFWIYGAHLLALPALVFRWLQLRGRFHEALILPPVLVIAFEFFPLPISTHLGETQSHFTMALQGSDLLGVYGLDGLIALVNATIYVVLARSPTRQDRFALVAVAATSIAWMGYGLYALSRWDRAVGDASSIRVGLVQPNAAPSAAIPDPPLGFSRAYPLELAVTASLAQQHASFVVWPEARYRGFFDSTLVRASYSRELQNLDALVLFQDVEHSFTAAEPLEFNTAALLSAGELVDRYRKTQRIAFGEYLPIIDSIPALRRWARANLGAFFATISPGKGPAVLRNSDFAIVPLICYETTLPRYVANALTAAPENRLLVAMSNDAWFGSTRAPYQHLFGSVVRAVENRVPLVHALNNGPSGVIDPTGRVRFNSGLGTTGGFLIDVPYAPSQPTFFAQHPRLFLGFCVGLLIVMLALALFGSQRFARSALLSDS
jgi:apolipoprotein N-acyltransferase